MKTLVVGATGATGSLLVKQLLDRNQHVKAVVRSPEKLPAEVRNHPNLSIITASILDIDAPTLAKHVQDCDAVASCLGHNVTFRGIWGPPRRLVTDAVHNLCEAITANAPVQPVRFVLMNTTSNTNRDLSESLSFAEKSTIGLIRILIPPQADNEQAADYLRIQIGQDHPHIKWVVVRPDGLTNEEAVTDYSEHASPTRSAIFNPGKTSRINVAHFMATLMTDTPTWNQWQGQMPVIYNTAPA